MKTYAVYYTVNDDYKSMTVKARSSAEARKIVRAKVKTPIRICETCVMNDWNFLN